MILYTELRGAVQVKYPLIECDPKASLMSIIY